MTMMILTMIMIDDEDDDEDDDDTKQTPHKANTNLPEWFHLHIPKQLPSERKRDE